jgi:adenylate cyclase
MCKRLAVFIFGQPVHSQLPERVRRSIDEQQVQAEKLIGWTQLALVVFFFVFYSLAPKTSAGTAFMPVPYVLGMYFLFTVTRLMLALKWVLPRWFLLGSVIGDIGLLMVLIWSFHLQYEQPAPFYLKAPTLLYVFIFISLRTLRFESIFVVAAGTAAAVGWFALLWYAIERVPGRLDVITRDYVHYLTSNTVLIGGEVDKIISILLVTLVLAVSQTRARRLLVRAVADATVVGDLSRFVAREVADQIATADRAIQPGDGEVKTASVLFCDIEGFSGIAERLSPDVLMVTLNEYFSAVHSVIERHGGVITEFRGDAMLVTFNTAKPDPDHAANALRTAIGIQELVRTRRFGSGIAMPTRCGISTGQVISGAVGTKERLLFTVHGDEVNVAARLEQMNKEHGTYVLASERTIRAAGAGFASRPIGEVTLRGRSTPATVYTITPSLPAPSPESPR